MDDLPATDDLARVDALLAFWLDEVGPQGWFRRDAAIDAACRRHFGALVEAAPTGAFAPWSAWPEGALARLILLDQLPRNIHRGDPRAHAGDALALATAKAAIARGHDLAIAPRWRPLFYLPLMHSERLADQERCVRLVLMRLPRGDGEGDGEGDAEEDAARAATLDAAIRHRAVIRRFARFPSRNACLARPDTEAERAYRAAGGYMG